MVLHFTNIVSNINDLKPPLCIVNSSVLYINISSKWLQFNGFTLQTVLFVVCLHFPHIIHCYYFKAILQNLSLFSNYFSLSQITLYWRAWICNLLILDSLQSHDSLAYSLNPIDELLFLIILKLNIFHDNRFLHNRFNLKNEKWVQSENKVLLLCWPYIHFIG